MDALPVELLLGIFQMLDMPTLVKASQVCHTWNRVSCDFTLWRKHYQERWSCTCETCAKNIQELVASNSVCCDYDFRWVWQHCFIERFSVEKDKDAYVYLHNPIRPLSQLGTWESIFNSVLEKEKDEKVQQELQHLQKNIYFTKMIELPTQTDIRFLIFNIPSLTSSSSSSSSNIHHSKNKKDNNNNKDNNSSDESTAAQTDTSSSSSSFSSPINIKQKTRRRRSGSNGGSRDQPRRKDNVSPSRISNSNINNTTTTQQQHYHYELPTYVQFRFIRHTTLTRSHLVEQQYESLSYSSINHHYTYSSAGVISTDATVSTSKSLSQTTTNSNANISKQNKTNKSRQTSSSPSSSFSTGSSSASSSSLLNNQQAFLNHGVVFRGDSNDCSDTPLFSKSAVEHLKSILGLHHTSWKTFFRILIACSCVNNTLCDELYEDYISFVKR